MCCTRSPACVRNLKQRFPSGLGEHCRYHAYPMERKPFSSILLAAILIPVGLVLYVAVLTYDHARTWTDLSKGISNGLIHCVLYSIGYVIVFVPLIAVAIFATRSQPKSFWLRSTICLSPLLAVCLFSAFIWFTNPITHRSCFESTMGFGMPISATNIQSERCGGGKQIYRTLTTCLLYTSPSPRDKRQSRMPSSA